MGAQIKIVHKIKYLPFQKEIMIGLPPFMIFAIKLMDKELYFCKSGKTKRLISLKLNEHTEKTLQRYI